MIKIKFVLFFIFLCRISMAQPCQVYLIGNRVLGSEKYLTVERLSKADFAFERVGKIGSRLVPEIQNTTYFYGLRQDHLKFEDGSLYVLTTDDMGLQWSGTGQVNEQSEVRDLDLKLSSYDCGQEPI